MTSNIDSADCVKVVKPKYQLCVCCRFLTDTCEETGVCLYCYRHICTDCARSEIFCTLHCEKAAILLKPEDRERL
jgi:hypothetical protein